MLTLHAPKINSSDVSREGWPTKDISYIERIEKLSEEQLEAEYDKNFREIQAAIEKKMRGYRKWGSRNDRLNSIKLGISCGKTRNS